RCTAHVASFLINNQQHCQTTKRSNRIRQWIGETLRTHSTHKHDFEVAWCLVVCGALKIKVRKSDLRDEGNLPNSIVFALLGLLHKKGLLSVNLSHWSWRAEFKKNGIYSHNWLPFYEAVLRKWSRDKRLEAAIKSDPVMAKMLQKKVSF